MIFIKYLCLNENTKHHVNCPEHANATGGDTYLTTLKKKSALFYAVRPKCI